MVLETKVSYLGTKIQVQKIESEHYSCPAQKIGFSIKDFFSIFDQIRRTFLRIWSHLLKKTLLENISFCAMLECSQAFKQYSHLISLKLEN